MAVLEHNPLSFFAGVLNEKLCLWSLSLTKRDGMKLIREVLVSCKLEQRSCWISTRCKHKDKWSVDRQLLIDDLHRGVGCLDIELAHLTDDELRDGHLDHFHSERLNHDELVEVAEILLVVAWHLLLVGILNLSPFFPCLPVVGDMLRNTLKLSLGSEFSTQNCLPADLVEDNKVR